MGCDIHDYVEVRTNGRWEATGDVFPHPYHREDSPSDVVRCWVTEGPDKDKYLPQYHRAYGLPCNDNCYVTNQRLCLHPYNRRNYDLFSILANVRNGYGFAGVPTGEGYVPISMPRGLPPDVSEEVRAEYDKWGRDGHSHSWLTLAELKAYDWNRTTRHTGLVDPQQFQEFLRDGKPTSWCGGVGGDRVREVGLQEMTRIAREGPPDPELSYYCRVHWDSSYADDVRDFLDQTIPRLEALGAPEDVRMVFWFDN